MRDQILFVCNVEEYRHRQSDKTFSSFELWTDQKNKPPELNLQELLSAQAVLLLQRKPIAVQKRRQVVTGMIRWEFDRRPELRLPTKMFGILGCPSIKYRIYLNSGMNSRG
jgi:hypothetical protein